MNPLVAPARVSRLTSRGTSAALLGRTVGVAFLGIRHEFPVDGVEHQLGRRRESRFLKNPRAIRAHGLWAQLHALRGRVDTLTGSELQEYLILAILQQLVRLAIAVRRELGCQLLRERLSDVLVSGVDVPNRRRELGR